MKNTKIITTIGPNSSKIEVLKNLISEGSDLIRINLSHADNNFCKDIIKKVRKIEKELNKPVGIMLDMEGPTVRVDPIKEKEVFLKENSEIKIYNFHVLCNNLQLSFNNPSVVNDLIIGDRLLLSDGKVVLVVINKEEDFVLCKVLEGGYIYSGRSVHLKDKTFNLPFLSDKDKESISFALKNDVDYLSLSYVKGEQDVLEVIDLLIENGNNHLSLISKIENNEALENLEEIAKISDGLMVARGDLGLEMSIEKLPFYQKNIIAMARKYGKISIVATDLLMSMTDNNYPARSEITDIYNAVMMSCDAVLLSGETTIGNYPVETVQTMKKVIMSAEDDFPYMESLEETFKDTKQDITSMIAYSVSLSAQNLQAKAIITNTISGYTARLISYFHPKCPILTLSPNIETVRSLTLNYGIIPIISTECKTTDSIVNMCMKESKKVLKLENNDLVIITGGFPISNKNTNFMKIEVIK